MDPAEVFLVSFIGVALLYRITGFTLFSLPLNQFAVINGSNTFLASHQHNFSAYMILYFSSFQLQVANPSQRMGKGGGEHA
jgi:hypothetical protein